MRWSEGDRDSSFGAEDGDSALLCCCVQPSKKPPGGRLEESAQVRGWRYRQFTKLVLPILVVVHWVEP